MKLYKLLVTGFFILFVTGTLNASALERDDIRGFIDEMSTKHGFKPDELREIFQKVEFSKSVIEAISRPAEILPWYRYRPIFLEADRIRDGVKFWQENSKALGEVEDKYGVPAELVVAIIGVETRYGRLKGKYMVINSLSTLAFDYPQRGSFFRSELEQYLLMTREQGFDPLSLKGSYAGAMGIPQFISSSFRSYAVDFNTDGIIDIWEDMEDAIGSVGNYFKVHGWVKGGMVAVPARVEGNDYKNIVTDELKPEITASELNKYRISTDAELSPGTMAKLLVLENRQDNEYWLGFENFYVITRYNHSMLYALAVFQLAEEIKSRYLKNSKQVR